MREELKEGDILCEQEIHLDGKDEVVASLNYF